jgi:DNA-binding response OmpR family regulator
MRGEGFTILVVDDSRSIRALLADALKSDGFTVLEAKDGREALDVLSRSKVDVVTLDMEMPVMDGLETCRRIRAEESTSRLPVLLLTARGREEDIRGGFAAGVTEYFLKPLDPKKLSHAAAAYARAPGAADRGRLAIVGGSRIEAHIIGKAAELVSLSPRAFPDTQGFLEDSGTWNAVVVELRLVKADPGGLINTLRTKVGTEVPVVTFSASSDPLAVMRSYMNGATFHMETPFDSAILATRLRSLMRDRAYQGLLEEDRVKQGRLELLKELHVALAHHLNNILMSFVGNIEILKEKTAGVDLEAEFKRIGIALEQVNKVLVSLRKSADADSIELEEYVSDTKMLKLDRD